MAQQTKQTAQPEIDNNKVLADWLALGIDAPDDGQPLAVLVDARDWGRLALIRPVMARAEGLDRGALATLRDLARGLDVPDGAALEELRARGIVSESEGRFTINWESAK